MNLNMNTITRHLYVIKKGHFLYLPILLASRPNRLVPIRYDTLPGRKAIPAISQQPRQWIKDEKQ